MRNRLVVSLALVVAATAGAWAWSQGEKAAPLAPPTLPARFQVSTGGQSAILVDTQSGQTWQLEESVDASGLRRGVWLPLERISNEEGVRTWLTRQRELGARK